MCALHWVQQPQVGVLWITSVGSGAACPPGTADGIDGLADAASVDAVAMGAEGWPAGAGCWLQAVSSSTINGNRIVFIATV